MTRKRLDQEVVGRGLVASRSQAESFIRLGKVTVDGLVVKKPGHFVSEHAVVVVTAQEQYVSRAGLKLASIAESFDLNFKGAVVLDVGSSTGGFTDYALKRGAKKVIAVEVGTNQLHPSLQNDPRIELHEQTDIRDFAANPSGEKLDIVVADVSFISLREILPSISKLSDAGTLLVMMVKPQFEAFNSQIKHKGVIKNEAMRRDILRDFEVWAKASYKIVNKADSHVSGEKGNTERFYLLKPLGART